MLKSHPLRVNDRGPEKERRLGVRAEQGLREAEVAPGNAGVAEIPSLFKALDRGLVQRTAPIEIADDPLAPRARLEDARGDGWIGQEALGDSREPVVERL